MDKWDNSISIVTFLSPSQALDSNKNWEILKLSLHLLLGKYKKLKYESLTILFPETFLTPDNHRCESIGIYSITYIKQNKIETDLLKKRFFWNFITYLSGKKICVFTKLFTEVLLFH